MFGFQSPAPSRTNGMHVRAVPAADDTPSPAPRAAQAPAAADIAARSRRPVTARQARPGSLDPWPQGPTHATQSRLHSYDPRRAQPNLRMLYRPNLAGAGKARVDQHAHQGMTLGWATGPDEAVKLGRLEARRTGRIQFFVSNWQYWITTSIAISGAIASISSASVAWMVFQSVETQSRPIASSATGGRSAQPQSLTGSKFAQLLAAGFAPHEIDEWEATERAALRAQGADESEIHRYFVDGIAKRPTARPVSPERK